jgi:hypothetical protein
MNKKDVVRMRVPEREKVRPVEDGRSFRVLCFSRMRTARI